MALAGCIAGAMAQDRGLARTWILQSIDGKAPFAQMDLALTFAADGSVRGLAGCNAFAGAYVLDGNSARLGSVALTSNQSCASVVLMQEESRYLELLNAVMRYDLTPDGALVLVTRSDNAIRYRPVP